MPIRTNIEIDDRLMARAMELTGLRTKRAVVDAALRASIERRSQLLRETFGKYLREGALDQMRPHQAQLDVTVVDSPVSSGLFEGSPTRQTDLLDGLLAEAETMVLVGDVVRCEIRAGFRSQREVERNRLLLDSLLPVSMLDFDLAPAAVANYQTLRSHAITPGTVDMIIATYLHRDGCRAADGRPRFRAEHLGLRLVEPA